MTDASEQEEQPSEIDVLSTLEAGVPLGGVGTGCIEMGRDGRFRNITINNNRTSATRIPVSAGSFLAVRAARRGRIATRVLQSHSDVHFAAAGIRPGLSPTEKLTWRGLYPTSRYRLEDPQFPLETSWIGMAPVVPYDLDSSLMPIIFVTLYLQNPTDSTIDVSTVFNWENLGGCDANHYPEQRGPIRPIVVQEQRGQVIKEQTESQHEGKMRFAGVSFGFRGDARTNAEGTYALVAKQQEEVEVSILSYDERDPRELEFFWRQFHDEGHLGNRISRSKKSHSGAVCCSFTLGPNRGRSIVYLFSWHCPRFDVNGIDIGNGYSNTYDDAVAVAARGLQYYQFYFKNVEDWQGRIMSSSLPKWLNKMLVNCNHVVTTNSMIARDNSFALFETPDDPRMATLDRRFYSSLGTLLFFPNLEEVELRLLARTMDGRAPGRLARRLGTLCFDQPAKGPSDDEMMDLGPKFVLMAYRNYQMTGKLHVLESMFPSIKHVMAYIAKHDVDGDGLPEQSGRSTTFEDWAVYGANSYTSGLWLTALRAYIRLARRLDQAPEVDKYREILERAQQSFQQRLWDADGGYYRLYDDPAVDGAHERRHPGCHVGQLAGQWYADFLCMGNLLPEAQVRSALDVIMSKNDRRNGVALGVLPDGTGWENPADVQVPARSDVSWPAVTAACYSSLLIAHGHPDRGLYAVQKVYKNIHVKRSRTFNQPLEWDLEANDATGWGMDRHSSAPSMWHMLFALEGFQLDIPDAMMWIRPDLPMGVHQLSAPLFTPISFGWLKYHEDDRGRYRQFIRVEFDSPVTVRLVILRVPEEVTEVQLEFVSQDGPMKTEHIFGNDGNTRLIQITPEKKVTVQQPLTIRMTQTAGRAFSFVRG